MGFVQHCVEIANCTKRQDVLQINTNAAYDVLGSSVFSCIISAVIQYTYSRMDDFQQQGFLKMSPNESKGFVYDVMTYIFFPK